MYRVGTVEEAKKIVRKVPHDVYLEVLRIVDILDKAYGENRDVYNSDGGFVFIAENKKDLNYFIRHYFDPRNGAHEAVQVISTGKGPYLDLFFLCNNEFSINLILPAALLPEITEV